MDENMLMNVMTPSEGHQRPRDARGIRWPQMVMASDLNINGTSHLRRSGKRGKTEAKNRITTDIAIVSTQSVVCWEITVSSNERSIDLK